jgi:hypothetical protein
MGFGVLYVRQWMDEQSLDERIRFARFWMGQILFTATDRPGPILLARLIRRLEEAGVKDAQRLAPALLEEQRALNRAEHEQLLAGRAVPQVLKSARRAGLLAPDILEALRLTDHPVLRPVLRSDALPDDDEALLD